jgi:hypothetical protein
MGFDGSILFDLERIVKNNGMLNARLWGDIPYLTETGHYSGPVGGWYAYMVIIGGSDAGISVALRAKECSPSIRITLLVADSFPNFSISGLPFFLSGEVPDWRTLAHGTIEEQVKANDRMRKNCACPT